MTPSQRFMILTVISFLTVTGFVVGCDSDDTPTVTPPSEAPPSGTTATRNMTAEQQGREGLQETDGGRTINNIGNVDLNIRFNYDEVSSGSGSGAGTRSTHTTARHYRLNVGAAMPSDPENTGTTPTHVACGVPAVANADYQCFDNDNSEVQSPPTPFSGATQSRIATSRVYEDRSLKNAERCYSVSSRLESSQETERLGWTGDEFGTMLYGKWRADAWGVRVPGPRSECLGLNDYEWSVDRGISINMYTCGNEGRVAVSSEDLSEHYNGDVSFPPIPFSAYRVSPDLERRRSFAFTRNADQNGLDFRVPKAVCKPENFASCRVPDDRLTTIEGRSRIRSSYAVYTSTSGSDYTCLVTEHFQ